MRSTACCMTERAMNQIRMTVALGAWLTLAACAAVPGNEMGTMPVRSPVTALDEEAVLPIAVEDPWEGFNRGAYKFNTQFDRWIWLPAVHAYEDVVPDPAEQAVSNFFNNLGEIRNGVNSALQLRGDEFGVAFARFFINTTVGMAGLI